MLEQSARKFWKKKSFFNYCLLPLACVYNLIFHLRVLFASPKRVNARVICIGNIVVGGSGKTPFAIALAKSLIKKRKKVAFLSRGYGGCLSNCWKAHKVSLSDDYKTVGDEPILLSKIAPTYICPDRFKAAQMAIKDGAKILIMDDGLQNFTLEQDEKILVIDENYGIGNGMLLPAGPLRESLSHSFNRVTDVFVIGDKIPNALKKHKPLLAKVSVEKHKKYFGKKYVLMCGIANPSKFVKTAQSLKIRIAKTFIFPDHHDYSETEFTKVIAESKKNRCKVLTTSKDYIKIPQELRKFFEVLSISIKIN